MSKYPSITHLRFSFFSPILPEEKKAIRERLLQFINEPSKKVILHVDATRNICSIGFFIYL
jgi:hypothetical protein